MVAQGRAAIVDRAQQHLLDGGDQPVGALALHGVGRAARRDAGQEQRLAGVDVADADQGLLIEQGRLDRRASSLETRRQRGAVESLVERLGPQALEQPCAWATASSAASSIRPKRRASLKRTCQPSSISNTTWSCRSNGCSAALCASCRVMRPDMPRWAIRVWPSSRRSSRYFARRSMASTVRPSTCCGEAGRQRHPEVLAALDRGERCAGRPVSE